MSKSSGSSRLPKAKVRSSMPNVKPKIGGVPKVKAVKAAKEADVVKNAFPKAKKATYPEE